MSVPNTYRGVHGVEAWPGQSQRRGSHPWLPLANELMHKNATNRDEKKKNVTLSRIVVFAKICDFEKKKKS